MTASYSLQLGFQVSWGAQDGKFFWNLPVSLLIAWDDDEEDENTFLITFHRSIVMQVRGQSILEKSCSNLKAIHTAHGCAQVNARKGQPDRFENVNFFV